MFLALIYFIDIRCLSSYDIAFPYFVFFTILWVFLVNMGAFASFCMFFFG